jgi:translocator protein
MNIKNILKFLITIIISELAGIVGAIFTTPSIPSWYSTLTKPALTPPAWVFGPVWTILFALMGIAAFLVWRNGWNKKEVKVALAIFIFQLILNTFWSIIFFGSHDPATAFIEIIALWLAIIVTIIEFHRVSKWAAYLLLPYIIWVSFAAYLNFSIWQFSTKVPTNIIACTMEAKLCSDGSYVGRIGPNCEFAPCP